MNLLNLFIPIVKWVIYIHFKLSQLMGFNSQVLYRFDLNNNDADLCRIIDSARSAKWSVFDFNLIAGVPENTFQKWINNNKSTAFYKKTYFSVPLSNNKRLDIYPQHGKHDFYFISNNRGDLS